MILLSVLTSSSCLADDQGISRDGMNFFLSKSQNVDMSSEVLDISESRIQVDFVFRNLSKTLEPLDIAFPFAEHDYYDSKGSCGGESRGAPAAKLSVEGKTWPFKWEYKFKLDGKLLPASWTELLLKVHPDPDGCGGGPEAWKSTANELEKNPSLLSSPGVYSHSGYRNFNQLAELYRKEFKRNDIERLSKIKVQEFLTWNYKFPPGQNVKVTHVFSDPTGFGNFDFSYEKDACLNQPPIEKIWARVKTGTYGCNPQFLRYVLTSGAAWARPIGKFTLIIRKPKHSLVSTCFSGLKKISDEEFHAERVDFMPVENLAVFWIDKECK
jgi:hypothetical protein